MTSARVQIHAIRCDRKSKKFIGTPIMAQYNPSEISGQIHSLPTDFLES